jgi:amino acid adenylation domain-containing protein
MSIADKTESSPRSWSLLTRAAPYAPIDPRGFGERAELSFSQQGLWALCQIEDVSLAYMLSFAWRLSGPLNADALKRSLGEIVRRHESLRTVFEVVDETPVPRVISPVAFQMHNLDLRGWPDCAREAEAQRMIERALRRPMDLAKGPLFRATLMRLRDEEHILLIAVHHIVADGSSVGVLMAEINVLYKAFCKGERSPLPELPVQYADFVKWQRNRLREELLRPQISYWKKQMEGASPLLPLPTDRLRPQVESYRGKTQHFTLGKDLTAGITALSRRSGVTVFMTLISALQTLLHRYTDSTDIISAFQTDGRERHELRGLIGFFVNPIVLRTDFSGQPTFLDILESVREKMLFAYAHRDVPFDKLVEALRPERNPSYNPLFQVVFAQQKDAWLKLHLAGVKSQFISVDNGTSKCDLHLYITEDSDELTGCLEFNSDLFDCETIQRMVGHFHNLLANAIANPNQPVATVPLMSVSERQNLLVGFNDTAAEYPAATIHQLFERQARKTPKAAAFFFEQESITYEELNGQANQLARLLTERGVARGMRVGVSMTRSLQLAVGLLAILKAGGVYVPLDPAYPPERLAFMVRDAEIQLLMCDSMPSWAAAISGMPMFLSQEISELSTAADVENINSPVSPDAPAYVIYTSGSTGRPKGVQASHRGSLNGFAWMWKKYPFFAGEVCCGKTALNFVDSVGEMWGALLQGIPTVLLPDDVVKDTPRLLQALASGKVSRIILVPSLLRVLLESGDDLAASLPDLRYWISSGEVLPVRSLQSFQQLLPGRILLNLYGSSEVAVGDATCYDARENSSAASVPIGRPISNTQIYILNSERQPMPIGIPGEICVGGDSLTSGYLNHPELTAEKFIINPFAGSEQTMLYRTGDRGRYLADGNVEFLGRMDNQVKVRGYRVELGEIESRLLRHPRVRQAVVVAFDDDISNKRIVAYVVPNSYDSSTSEGNELASGESVSTVSSANPALNGLGSKLVPELRSFLEISLASYMIPSAFVLLSSLPFLPNGKVDRCALPAPDNLVTEREVNYVAPRDLLEQQLIEIWGKALGMAKVGVRDDFFTLGGHSLLAVSVLRQVEKAVGKKMPLVALLQAPTVEGFANALRNSGWAAPAVIAVQPKGSRPAFFCIYDRIDYGNLEGELGNDQPLYVLPFDQMFDKHIKRGFVEVAQEFVSRIRKVQPEGPYYLGGMCLGGRIAFAIACEFYKQGETVGLLAIIDSPAPGYRSKVAAMSRTARLRYHLLDDLKFEWGILKTLSLRQKIDTIVDTIKLDAARYKRKLKWLSTKLLYRLLDKEIPVERRDSFHLMRDAIGDYCPPDPYPGKVILFRPAKRPGDRHVGMGWQEFPVGELHIHVIPGRHIEMLRKPNVEILGQILSDSLHKVQAEALAARLLRKSAAEPRIPSQRIRHPEPRCRSLG